MKLRVSLWGLIYDTSGSGTPPPDVVPSNWEKAVSFLGHIPKLSTMTRLIRYLVHPESNRVVNSPFCSKIRFIISAFTVTGIMVPLTTGSFLPPLLLSTSNLKPFVSIP